MEEVDKIVIYNLRQIGCDIEDDITSIKQFDADMIVNAAVRCLEAIKPGLKLPHSLPPNMAARYRVGQEIAQACLDQGYPGDIGYQSFLYSGEADVRKILMFLVEKLPKGEDTLLREPTGSELLMKKIKCKVKEELARPWLPYGIKKFDASIKYETCTDINLAPPQAWRKFWRDDLPLDEISNVHLLPTVITLHSRGVLSKYHPQWFVSKKPGTVTTPVDSASVVISPKRKPMLPPKPTARVLKPDAIDGGADQLDQSTSEENTLMKEIEKLQSDIDKLQLRKQQLDQDLGKEEQLLSEAKKKNVLKARIVELLPEAEDNLEKLKDLIERRTEKLVHLATQWESRRQPLLAQYRQFVSQHSSKESESAKRAETVRTLGERRRELEIELRGKDKLMTQLRTEAERSGKEAHRAAYTRRILEIIGNVEKQQLEIAKVLKDTQDVQKEINTLSGQLDRCFTLADETIFADAKRDEMSRKAYKLLVTLHTDCGYLVSMVQETGNTLREIRDLEDQIDKERTKDISGNLARITADLQQMQQESEALATQLKLKTQNKQLRKQTPPDPS